MPQQVQLTADMPHMAHVMVDLSVDATAVASKQQLWMAHGMMK